MPGQLRGIQAAGDRAIKNRNAVLQLERHGLRRAGRGQIESRQQIVEVRRSQTHMQLLPQRPCEIEARGRELEEGVSQIDGYAASVITGVNHTFDWSASRSG